MFFSMGQSTLFDSLEQYSDEWSKTLLNTKAMRVESNTFCDHSTQSKDRTKLSNFLQILIRLQSYAMMLIIIEDYNL